MVSIVYILSLIESLGDKENRDYFLLMTVSGSCSVVSNDSFIPRCIHTSLEDLRDWLELELAPER